LEVLALDVNITGQLSQVGDLVIESNQEAQPYKHNPEDYE
jgi:hypothetical protein